MMNRRTTAIARWAAAAAASTTSKVTAVTTTLCTPSISALAVASISNAATWPSSSYSRLHSPLLRPALFSTDQPTYNRPKQRGDEEDHGDGGGDDDGSYSSDEGWQEEEDDAEPEIGDGGDGGGVELRGVDWGEKALSIAQQVLDLNFDTDDMKMFAFKISPKGFVYVRIDKISHKYGCPSIDEIERFNRLLKEQLEESGKRGEIPDNLAVEVSSPGASRLLRVPDDVDRFKGIPMVVDYVEEDEESKMLNKKEGVFFLDSLDSAAGLCTWKLANVKENKDSASRGRPLSKKQKDWRLTLPFVMIRRITFYLGF